MLEIVARHHDSLEEQLARGVELEIVESYAMPRHGALAPDAASHALQERLAVPKQDLERDPRADLDRVVGGQHEMAVVEVSREDPDGLPVVATLGAKNDAVSHGG